MNMIFALCFTGGDNDSFRCTDMKRQTGRRQTLLLLSQTETETERERERERGGEGGTVGETTSLMEGQRDLY